MIITKIVPLKRRKNRRSVFLDGEYAFSVSDEVAARCHLKEGAEVDETELRRIAMEDQRREALDISFRLLALQARSRKELKDKLEHKSFDASVIADTLERLNELGYMDDRKFAAQRLNTLRSQGKGREWIKADLKEKGITNETISGIFSEHEFTPAEELAAASALADKKWKHLAGIPAQAAVRRLAGFLNRRGFSSEAIAGALRHLRRTTGEEDE